MADPALPVQAAERAVLAGVDVFEVAAVGMVVTDRTGRLQRVNRAFAELMGARVRDLVGTPFSALTCPCDLARSEQVMADLLADPGQAARLEKRYQRPDGGLVWADLTITPLRDADGTVTSFLTQAVDITPRKTAESQLTRASEDARRLALVAEVAQSALVIADPDGRIQWVNDAFCRVSGYRREEALGRRRHELLHGPGVHTPAWAAFVDHVVRGEPADGEFHLMSADGRPYVAQFEVRPVIEDGVVTHLVGVERDITERHQAQEALRIARTRSEWLTEQLTHETELLSSVISAVPQMVYWKDARGRYVGCNAAYLSFHGHDTLAELHAREESSLEPAGQLTSLLRDLERNVLASGDPVIDRQVALLDPQNRRRVLLLSVLPLGTDTSHGHGVVGVAADITQVHELEQKLAQSSRLESIGQLAAGIAHEINTPVQYISSNTTFLTEATGSLVAAAEEIERLVAGPDAACPEAACARLRALVGELDLGAFAVDVPDALAESQEGLTRLTQIVRAMKDYAHPGTTLQDTDINRAIETTTQVCRNEWKYVARLELDLSPDAGTAPCYAGELKQAVLNLVVNAAQALAEQRAADPSLGLGTLTISTRRTSDHVLITVGDDGPGMTAEVRQRIFDPFFTTKEAGKGTGQGLGLVRSVVVGKHHGTLDVESSPGKGARFTLRLPLQPPQPDAAGSPPEGTAGAEPS